MPKWCRDCGREKKPGHICDMAQLTDGSIVHVSRIDPGGDLREKIGADLQVVNRWIKKPDKKTKARKT